MSNNNVNLDRYYARFNPDDLSTWLDQSPAAFIFAAMHDLGTFISLMHGWAALWVDEIKLGEVTLTPSLRQLVEQLAATLNTISQTSHNIVTAYSASRSHEEFESQPPLSAGSADKYAPERAALDQLQGLRPHCLQLRALTNSGRTRPNLNEVRLPGNGGGEMSLLYLLDLMLIYLPPIERILDTATAYCRRL